VWLTKSDNPDRKTAFDLIAVQKGPRLVNMDAQAPNAVFGEYVRAGHFLPDTRTVRAEVRYGDSRFDFCVQAGDATHYVEVKGVTLEENGAVRFPDAPTERGVKHLKELQKAAREGHGAHAVFVIQMADVTAFSPNDDTHPAFGAALREAVQNGVQVHAFWCDVTPDTMHIAGEVPVKL
jgi:sugar fermentation stimulation protein A